MNAWEKVRKKKGKLQGKLTDELMKDIFITLCDKWSPSKVEVTRLKIKKK